MKILVTGGSGFLGHHVIREMRERGHDLVTTDIVGDVDILGDLRASAFTKKLPSVDTVIHCAAKQYVSPDLPIFARKRYFSDNNIAATCNLCERYNGEETHFINIGSSMMYRPSAQELVEGDSNFIGNGLYSQSKSIANERVQQLKHWSTIIPCIIGGEGRGGLFELLIKTIQYMNLAIIPGNGKHPIHCVHVKDVASLIASVAENHKLGIYNCGSSIPLSIEDWVSIFSEEAARHSVRRFNLPMQLTKMIAMLSFYRLLAREQIIMLNVPHKLSTTRAESIGWKPRYSNDQVLRETARHILRRKNERAQSTF